MAEMQNQILNYLRKRRITVRIYLTNGFQIKGRINSFDHYSILVKDGERQQNMIYKSAISTIVPSEYVEIENIVAVREKD
ncbi:MAG: RNA chaperone Hfq [Mesoaciditoga sp.]|nr:MAG: RNA chaperone Hfq [Mesoaciditoga sp.]